MVSVGCFSGVSGFSGFGGFCGDGGFFGFFVCFCDCPHCDCQMCDQAESQQVTALRLRMWPWAQIVGGHGSLLCPRAPPAAARPIRHPSTLYVLETEQR